MNPKVKLKAIIRILPFLIILLGCKENAKIITFPNGTILHNPTLKSLPKNFYHSYEDANCRIIISNKNNSVLCSIALYFEDNKIFHCDKNYGKNIDSNLLITGFSFQICDGENKPLDSVLNILRNELKLPIVKVKRPINETIEITLANSAYNFVLTKVGRYYIYKIKG